MPLFSPVIFKRCRHCGLGHPVKYFQRHRAVCRFCQQTLRDHKKARDRFPSKVQWSRQSHARRLHRPARELREAFGWTDAAMVRDARQVWRDGCPSCGRNIAIMPNRLFDLVLCLIDRAVPPHYGANTRWCCTYCRSVEVHPQSPGQGEAGARSVDACARL